MRKIDRSDKGIAADYRITTIFSIFKRSVILRDNVLVITGWGTFYDHEAGTVNVPASFFQTLEGSFASPTLG